MGRNVEGVNIYRVGHPLAQRVIEKCLNAPTPIAELAFLYSDSKRNIAAIEPLKGQSGWLRFTRLTVEAFQTEDFLIFTGLTDGGSLIDSDQCRRLMTLDADVSTQTMGNPSGEVLNKFDVQEKQVKEVFLRELDEKNAGFFGMEMDKLDRWGEDQRNTLRRALQELDRNIKDLGRQARTAPNLPEKLKLEREKQQLEAKRDEAWKEYDRAAKDVENKKGSLIDDVEKRLENKPGIEEIFTIRWTLI
jgi:hypothetical protein